MAKICYGVIISLELYLKRQAYNYFDKICKADFDKLNKDERYFNYKEWPNDKLFREIILREISLGAELDTEYHHDIIYSEDHLKVSFLLATDLWGTFDEDSLPIYRLDNLDYIFIGYSIDITNKLIPISNSVSEEAKGRLNRIIDEVGFSDLIVDFYASLELDFDTKAEYENKKKI